MYRTRTPRHEMGLSVSCDCLTCTACRAGTNLAVGISSCESVSRWAQWTANTLNLLDEGQFQEPMGSLD